MVLTKHERQMNDNQYRGFIFDFMKSFAMKNFLNFWDFTLYDDDDGYVEIDFNNGLKQLYHIEDMFPVLNIKIKNAHYITFDTYGNDITLAVRLLDGDIMYVEDNVREWFIENTTLY